MASLLVAGEVGHPVFPTASPAGRLVLFGRSLLLGRRPPPLPPDEMTVWAVRDGRVSGVHLRIDPVEDGFEVSDQESMNGTFVDGVRIEEPVRLREGAVLFFGHQVAVFRTMSARELEAVRRDLAEPFGPVPLLSPVFVAVTDKLRRLALGSGELLLVGETGVGKEVYARAIHDASGRTGKFVAVNCAAIPRELVETELFGFVRGAHSEARENKPGLLDEADGGTLFLDEIGEMSPELQAKLLRFVQDRMMTPVGATVPRKIDARILAATNRFEAPAAAEDRGLRRDLVARLGAEPMRLPSLREHIEDVGALAAYFLRGSDRRLTPPALRALHLHGWPGNVRELEKALQEALVLSRGQPAIDLEHLPPRLHGAQRPPPAPLPRDRPTPTGAQLEELLRRHKGNMTHVARELQRQPALVYRWVQRFRLDPEAYREKGGPRAARGAGPR
ncbi:MAG TPA: sigma 54-interacting transcriptional regulator [Polyangia bacterium]|nr:sigma 54-interacting transcriptional regulator [Polyangia bacterium]